MRFLVAFDVSNSHNSNHQSFWSLTVESVNVMGYVLTANAHLNQPVEAPDPILAMPSHPLERKHVIRLFEFHCDVSEL